MRDYVKEYEKLQNELANLEPKLSGSRDESNKAYEILNHAEEAMQSWQSEWDMFNEQMNSLLPFAIGMIGDAFAAYDVVPFGLVEDDFVSYAMSQFSKRFERLEKAKGASLDEINRVAREFEET